LPLSLIHQTFFQAILDSYGELNAVQVDVLQKSVIWADMGPLSCYGTDEGAKAEAEMDDVFGLPQLQTMIHAFVSGLVAKKLLTEDAVVVVLGNAPWSCCEELENLLPELGVYHVHHPMYTGMYAFAHCRDAHMLPAMQAPNNGEQRGLCLCMCVTPRVSHTSSPTATLLQAYSAMFHAVGVNLPRPVTYFTKELAKWRACPKTTNSFSYKFTDAADRIKGRNAPVMKAPNAPTLQTAIDNAGGELFEELQRGGAGGSNSFIGAMPMKKAPNAPTGAAGCHRQCRW
jgi:hypothetical protein